MTDIEHVHIDQNTEDQVEFVINQSQALGVFENDEEKPDVKDILPGGNVLRFLDTIIWLANASIDATQSQIGRNYLINALQAIKGFKSQQQQTFSMTGSYSKFPTNKAPLSDFLDV